MMPVLGSDGATFLQSLNWVDTLVIIVVLASATAGFLSGIVWQALRIASILVAFAVATRFHLPLADWLAGNLPDQTRLMVCYFALLAGVLVVTCLVLFLVRAPINSLKVEAPDRAVGAALGMAKGLLICGIIAIMVTTFTPSGTPVAEAVKGSPLAQRCSLGARWLWGLMPGGSPAL